MWTKSQYIRPVCSVRESRVIRFDMRIPQSQSIFEFTDYKTFELLPARRFRPVKAVRIN